MIINTPINYNVQNSNSRKARIVYLPIPCVMTPSTANPLNTTLLGKIASKLQILGTCLILNVIELYSKSLIQ